MRVPERTSGNRLRVVHHTTARLATVCGCCGRDIAHGVQAISICRATVRRFADTRAHADRSLVLCLADGVVWWRRMCPTTPSSLGPPLRAKRGHRELAKSKSSACLLCVRLRISVSENGWIKVSGSHRIESSACVHPGLALVRSLRVARYTLQARTSWFDSEQGGKRVCLCANAIYARTLICQNRDLPGSLRGVE